METSANPRLISLTYFIRDYDIFSNYILCLDINVIINLCHKRQCWFNSPLSEARAKIIQNIPGTMLMVLTLLFFYALLWFGTCYFTHILLYDFSGNDVILRLLKCLQRTWGPSLYWDRALKYGWINHMSPSITLHISTPIQHSAKPWAYPMRHVVFAWDYHVVNLEYIQIISPKSSMILI